MSDYSVDCSSGSGLGNFSRYSNSDPIKWYRNKRDELIKLNTFVGNYNFLNADYSGYSDNLKVPTDGTKKALDFNGFAFKFEPRFIYGKSSEQLSNQALDMNKPYPLDVNIYWYDHETDSDVLLSDEQKATLYNRLAGVVEEQVDKFLIDSGNNSNDILNQDEPAQDEIMSMMEVDGEEIDTADCLVCANCFEDLEYEDSAWKDGDPYHKDCLKEIEKTGFDYSEYLD
jgi:hypothetical protein